MAGVGVCYQTFAAFCGNLNSGTRRDISWYIHFWYQTFPFSFSSFSRHFKFHMMSSVFSLLVMVDSFMGTVAWRQRCRADLTPCKSLSSSSSRWFSGWHGWLWLWCVGVWIGACVFMRLYNKRRWMLNSLGTNHHQLSKHGTRYLQHVSRSFGQCGGACFMDGKEFKTSSVGNQGFVSF